MARAQSKGAKPGITPMLLTHLLFLKVSSLPDPVEDPPLHFDEHNAIAS
jgi:hypothetical protein